MLDSSFERIKEIASEVSEREGCVLYDLELTSAGGQRVLRLYIDRVVKKQIDELESRLNLAPEGDSQSDLPVGASIDDCANVSRGMSLRLDVEDLIPGGRYELEVSTPGIERPLKQKWHYDWATNKLVLVKLNQGIEIEGEKKPIKNLKGILVVADDEKIQLKLESEAVVDVPYEQIHKANTVFEFVHPGKQKAAKKGKNKKH